MLIVITIIMVIIIMPSEYPLFAEFWFDLDILFQENSI